MINSLFPYTLTNAAHTEIFPVINGLPDAVIITAVGPIVLAGDIEFTSDNPAPDGQQMVYRVNVSGGISLNTHTFKLNDYTFGQEILTFGDFYVIFIANGTDWGSPYIVNSEGTVLVPNQSITNAMMAQMPTMTVKGNNTGGLSVPLDLTMVQLKAMIPIIVEAGAGADSLKRTAFASNAAGAGAVNLGNASCIASGDNTFVSGDQNTASGLGAEVGGVANLASGDYSVAKGYGNTASGPFSVAIGNLNEATGDTSLATGDHCKAIGDNSIAQGLYSEASGTFSKANGYYANANKQGQVANSGGPNNASYYSQQSTLFLRANTVNATPEAIVLDGSGGLQLPVIAQNSSARFKGTVVAVQNGGAAGTVGDTATFDFYGTIKNIAGVTSLVGSIVYMDGTGAITNVAAQSAGDAGAVTWSAVVTADNPNSALQIEVAGEVNKSIYWHCVLELNEIKFAA